MWCNTCKAAVPAVIDFSQPEGRNCGRCGEKLTDSSRLSDLKVARFVSKAPSTLAFDDPWAIDLDLARIKRRVQSAGDAIRVDALPWTMPGDASQLTAPTLDVQLQPAIQQRVTERSRTNRDEERRTGALLTEMFIWAVASWVGFGMLIGSRPIVELGLGMGSVAVVICLLLWIAEPANSTRAAKYDRTDIESPESRAA